MVEIYLVFAALLVGSFINLAADRLPRGESIVRPRSHCRGCGRRLNLVDLLPVAGYAIRGGRCATCRVPIGILSPLVELTAGLCMALPLLTLDLWPGGLIGLILIAAFGVIVISMAMRKPLDAGAERGLEV